MDKKYAQFLLNKVRNNYNEIAGEFSNTRQILWPEAKPLFDYIKSGNKVLDLGCGNGRCVEIIKAKGGEYTGIDISDKLIEIAKKRYPAENFQVGDALSLPYPDNSFGIIYSIAVLHHIPSAEMREKFLQEASRVLNLGGFFILTVWQPKDKPERQIFWQFLIKKILGLSKLDFRDIIEPWFGQAQGERYYHCFTQKELVKLVRKAGFVIQESGIIKNEKGNRSNLYIVAKKV
ncbi:MAG: class I SAM-dependent methyltransferase [Candidatus Gribaldobacteria bacterium]|nr:class I SAM-dependent methyltransferase [Candidatus Gribaldobacteria bacterium]